MSEFLIIFNIVVAVLVILFVALAMGQVVFLELNKDTTENLLIHKGIAYLGMGSAFYALFIARIHFSDGGWMGLVAGVLGIVGVGALIQRIRRGPRPTQEIKKKKIETFVPDETKPWCWTCREHTRAKKGGGGCSNCGGTYYRMNVPIGDRKAGYGCSGCAAVPVLVAMAALLTSWGPGKGLLVALMMGLFFLVIVGFPIVFLYRYWTWRKWARLRRQYPYESDSEEQDPSSTAADEKDGSLSDEDV